MEKGERFLSAQGGRQTRQNTISARIRVQKAVKLDKGRRQGIQPGLSERGSIKFDLISSLQKAVSLT